MRPLERFAVSPRAPRWLCALLSSAYADFRQIQLSPIRPNSVRNRGHSQALSYGVALRVSVVVGGSIRR